MYFFYSLLLCLALLVFLPVYFFKLRLRQGESLYLRLRLGIRLPECQQRKQAIWIHAVSVGEVLSIQNLVREIKKRHPSWEVNFSILTNTGYRIAREKIKEADNIFFVPFDFGFIVRRFFEKIRPRLLILVESEFWPHLLREAKKRSCPVLVVNGRVSERSFRRLIRVRFPAKKILRNIEQFLVQTGKDKEKLEKIGISSSRIFVSGNLKSEVNLPLVKEEEILKLRQALSIPEAKKIIVAGSIHKGEEDLLLEAFKEARKKRGDILLVLAPRHPKKFNELEKLAQSFQLKILKRTQVKANDSWDVLILDTIGELSRFYALSDAAFIGGSLVPRGGQNLLEPAFYEKPVFFGPHMDNFAFLAEEFVRAQAARIVQKKEDLVELFLFRQEEALREMGRRGKELLNSFQGATEMTLKAIENFVADN